MSASFYQILGQSTRARRSEAENSGQGIGGGNDDSPYFQALHPLIMPDQATKERYRSAQRQGNCFYDTLGSYCFYTQSIELSSLSEDDLVEVAKLGAAYKASGKREFPEALFEKLKKIQPVSAHEYTHFLDSTATVWGLDLLVSLYRAYNLDKDETQYFRAKDAHEQIEGIKMPPYYSLIEKSVPQTRPWNYRISSGSIFDKNGKPSSRQIPFLHFLNAENEFLARAPISLLSMLEASATFQELCMHAGLIGQLSKDAKSVENALFSQTFTGRLYDSQLTEYSVCTHFVANRHHISDAMVAYYYTAALSRFCLNLKSTDISKFTILEAVATALYLDGFPQRQEIIARLNASLAVGDRAVLFSVLARTCEIPAELPKRGETRAILSKACQLFGLELEALETSAQEGFLALHEQLASLPNVPPALAASCLHNFKAQGDIFNVDLEFPSLELPPAVYGDCNSRPAFIGGRELFKGFDVWKHFTEVDPRREWVRQFSEACFARPD